MSDRGRSAEGEARNRFVRACVKESVTDSAVCQHGLTPHRRLRPRAHIRNRRRCRRRNGNRCRRNRRRHRRRVRQRIHRRRRHGCNHQCSNRRRRRCRRHGLRGAHPSGPAAGGPQIGADQGGGRGVQHTSRGFVSGSGGGGRPNRAPARRWLQLPHIVCFLKRAKMRRSDLFYFTARTMSISLATRNIFS